MVVVKNVIYWSSFVLASFQSFPVPLENKRSKRASSFHDNPSLSTSLNILIIKIYRLNVLNALQLLVLPSHQRPILSVSQTGTTKPSISASRWT